jgi:hypothetical protein
LREIPGAVRADGPGSATAAADAAAVRGKKQTLVLVSLAVLVVAGLLAGGWYYRSRKSRQLTEKDTIVVADFDNKTGDPIFDDTLKQALRVQLEQSPFLNILSDHKISETLKLMNRSPAERVSLDLATEICVRSGSTVLLAGTISTLGSSYLMSLNATACGSGDTLAAEQAQAGNKEEVLKILGSLASGVRGKLGRRCHHCRSSKFLWKQQLRHWPHSRLIAWGEEL